MRYFQGDVATHGLHLLLTSDSDNAYQTQPVDEIDSTDTQMMLPPNEPNIGTALDVAYVAPMKRRRRRSARAR